METIPSHCKSDREFASLQHPCRKTSDKTITISPAFVLFVATSLLYVWITLILLINITKTLESRHNAVYFYWLLSGSWVLLIRAKCWSALLNIHFNELEYACLQLVAHHSDELVRNLMILMIIHLLIMGKRQHQNSTYICINIIQLKWNLLTFDWFDYFKFLIIKTPMGGNCYFIRLVKN